MRLHRNTTRCTLLAALLLGISCISVRASEKSHIGRIVMEAPPRFIGFGCGRIAVGKCVPISQLPVDEKDLRVDAHSFSVHLIDQGFGINYANRKAVLTHNQVSLWLKGVIEIFRGEKVGRMLVARAVPVVNYCGSSPGIERSNYVLTGSSLFGFNVDQKPRPFCVYHSPSVEAGSLGNFAEVFGVVIHSPQSAVENNGLNDQSQELKNPNADKSRCVIDELPLYLYVIFVLICAAISFGGGVLVVDSNCAAWRACGVFLFLLGIGGYASAASTFVYGSPLVIWGLGDANDCEGEHGEYDDGLFHSESVLAPETIRRLSHGYSNTLVPNNVRNRPT